MTTLVSFNDFAFNVGKLRKSTREASLPLHQAYVKATPEQQSDLRSRWMQGHIMGALECTEKTADRILSQSRTERSEAHQDAVKSASADFNYHVIRDYKPEGGERGKADPVEALLKKYAALTAAQKRKFLSAI